MGNSGIRRSTVLIGGSATAAAFAVPGVAATSATALITETDATRWVGGLGFNGDGQVVALQTASGGAATLDSPGGLFVSDPVSGERKPVTGRTRPARAGIVVHAEISELSVVVDVEYQPANGGTVNVTGAVRDTTGEDRVLDTVFGLPLPVTSGAWGRDIARMESYGPNGASTTQLSMPVASVADPTSSFAVAYTIPPERPSRFEMTVKSPIELEAEVAWQFETDGDAEGWFPIGAEPQITPLEVANGIASATSTGTRPIMQQRNSFSVDAEAGVVVEVTMQATASGTGFVNWTTVDAPSFDGSRRANFSVTASDDMQIYRVELHVGAEPDRAPTASSCGRTRRHQD